MEEIKELEKFYEQKSKEYYIFEYYIQRKQEQLLEINKNDLLILNQLRSFKNVAFFRFLTEKQRVRCK